VKSEDRAILHAPAQRVWAVLAEWRRYPEWMPDVAWVRSLGPGREAALKLLVRTRVFGFPVANDIMRVTAWEPPTKLAILHEGVVRGPAEWLLKPVDGGRSTRFTWAEDVTMWPPYLGELGLRIYWPWQRRMFRRSIENVRRLVERP
jgi:Polyketide cyclase / dehydrase and lipid transport